MSYTVQKNGKQFDVVNFEGEIMAMFGRGKKGLSAAENCVRVYNDDMLNDFNYVGSRHHY